MNLFEHDRDSRPVPETVRKTPGGQVRPFVPFRVVPTKQSAAHSRQASKNRSAVNRLLKKLL